MLGLLYDVHGNLPALEAVLADCPAEQFLLGGDYAVAGAWPTETLDRLRGLDAEWIRGNTERWLVDTSDAPAGVMPILEKAREALGQGEIDRLVALPETTSRGTTLFCHGSPGSDMDSFLPDSEDEDERLLAGVDAERVVFGHTHLQFQRRTASGIQLVNPGSVGMPWDGDHRAAYAVVHDDGRMELRRAEYDWRSAAKAVRERVGELPAARIEQARFDPV